MTDKVAHQFLGFSSLNENKKFVCMLSQDDTDSINGLTT